jgi:hypothetical protein
MCKGGEVKADPQKELVISLLIFSFLSAADGV